MPASGHQRTSGGGCLRSALTSTADPAQPKSHRAGAEEPSSATEGVSAPARFPLICCFRMEDGLNTNTRRGEIGTSVPVFGLRPIRWFLFRTTKEPNDDSFTVSPVARVL